MAIFLRNWRIESNINLFAAIERVLKEKLAGAPVPMDIEGRSVADSATEGCGEGPAAAAMKETSIRGDFREQCSGSRRAGLVLALRSEWLFETVCGHSVAPSK